MSTAQFRVVVVGGGIAGIESLLALRELAGDRVSLTLLSPDDRFRLRADSVAEPFALGHVRELLYTQVAADLSVEHVAARAAGVDDAAGEVRTDAGDMVAFDALLLTPGATMTDTLEHALTWRPQAAAELFGGLLRDIEEGYVKRVAFVVPPGPTWPLPAFELALMTARQAGGMGTAAEISVVTAEGDPLSSFGLEAGDRLRELLTETGIRLVTGTTVHVEKRPALHLAPEPAGDAIAVDRVVAMPVLTGPDIGGVPRDEHGFIRTGPHGRVEGCSRTWSAGDGIASPLKLGGLATHQARLASEEIARAAGVQVAGGNGDDLELYAVLMTGEEPVALDDRPLDPAAGAPRWWPARKVASRYLADYLARAAAR